MELKHIVGNFFYILLGGPIFFMQYCIFGALTCLTLIGFPVGLEVIRQSYPYTLFPFGRKVVPKNVSRDCTNDCLLFSANALWFCCGGCILILEHFFVGVFLIMSLVGIPLGLQHLKMIKFAWAPYGATTECIQPENHQLAPSVTNVVIVEPNANTPLTQPAPAIDVNYPALHPAVGYQAVAPPFNPQVEGQYGYYPYPVIQDSSTNV